MKITIDLNEYDEVTKNIILDTLEEYGVEFNKSINDETAFSTKAILQAHGYKNHNSLKQGILKHFEWRNLHDGKNHTHQRYGIKYDIKKYLANNSRNLPITTVKNLEKLLKI